MEPEASLFVIFLDACTWLIQKDKRFFVTIHVIAIAKISSLQELMRLERTLQSSLESPGEAERGDSKFQRSKPLENHGYDSSICCSRDKGGNAD